MFDTIRNQAELTVLIKKVKEMLDTDKIDKIIYDFVVHFNKVNSTPQYEYITKNIAIINKNSKILLFRFINKYNINVKVK